MGCKNMKKINLLAAAVLAAGALSSSAVFAAPANMSGYFRAGAKHSNNVNNNNYQVGRVGRLGNESGFADILFSADIANVNDTVWSMGYMISMGEDGNRKDWHSNFACRQLYGEVKGLFGGLDDGTLWVGKRYGQREDVHITDHYYYIGSWGTGVGIENLTLGSGKLSFNWVTNDQADIKLALKNNVSDRDILDKTFNEDTYSWNEEADAGVWKHEPSYKTAGTVNTFDVRYKFPVWDGASFQVGESYMTFERGDNEGWYKQTKGVADVNNSNLVTLELNQSLLGGFNNTVYQFVKGSTAQDIHWGAGSAVDNNGNSNNAYGHRLMNFGCVKFADNFGMMHVLSGAISGDYTDNTDVHKSFQLVVRPFLQLTKMTRIYAEAGWSVDSVDVKDKTKGKKKVEQAQKYTLAYAITPDASNFWSRPEIRFFYSYVHGNGVGNTSMPGTSEKAGYVVSQDNFFGAQIEAMF